MMGKKEEQMGKGSALRGLEKLLSGTLGDIRGLRKAVTQRRRTGRPAPPAAARTPKPRGNLTRIKAGGQAAKGVAAPKPERVKNKGKRCAILGCEKWASAKGICANHYQQRRRRLQRGAEGELKRGRPRVQPLVCSVQDCGKIVVAKGLCATHYQAQRRGRLRPKLRSGLESKPKLSWIKITLPRT
ncbi:MAG: hypothetical protein A2V67_11590 [Deltaproteobacteria bacterium RBG_13_61_14]|nr:MAG: hypothetical protein A2V67_11590 [Deltaproteobacteria bacterium RBG_13_61_14]